MIIDALLAKPHLSDKCIACQFTKTKNLIRTENERKKGRMNKRYFDDPEDNVAFERCIDVLAELIEKYSGLFALNDVGYEYYVNFALTPMVTSVFSFEDYRNRVCKYTTCGVRTDGSGDLNNSSAGCQKAD